MGIDRKGRAGARLLAGVALAVASLGAGAKELVSPVGMFVEGGLARDARSLVVGAAWTWLQPSRWDGGRWSGYLETSLGEWACHKHTGRRYEGCSTQLGITPVIRFSGLAWTHWYLELGIGADLVFPLYETDQHRFATEFEFGDHLGIGRKFGEEGRDEIELRAEHYSNGGYKNPNPGENWLQLRYMHWF
ncbi:MAG TPA: acyloxyacyl hydrolase [Burkholderiaceae bacterium]